VEARVALAQELWNCAASQDDLAKVEALLVQARTIAKESNSALEVAQEPVAASKLARLLYQEGRAAEAEPLLIEHGFSHRLSTPVLCGGHASCNPAGGEGGRGRAKGRDDLLAIVDDVFPESMLAHLQALFDVDSPFWREHNYHSKSTGYFSYTHALDCPPSSNLDQIMHYLWKLAIVKFPEASRATRVEWWAHNRPHPSGHQLHFDSDNEGLGGVRNPIVTSVCYLSQGMGGPTLITDQNVSDSTLACTGWLVHPKKNRFVVFDGQVLHGVIPGRSFNPSHGSRRVTWMVAFWESITERGSAEEGPCASRNFPVEGQTKYTWCNSLFHKKDEWREEELSFDNHKSGADDAVSVAQVFSSVLRPGASEGEATGMPQYDACFQGF